MHERAASPTFSAPLDMSLEAADHLRTRSWTPAEDGPRRWRFAGKRDAAMNELYVCRNVIHYRPNGAQNPIRYVNC